MQTRLPSNITAIVPLEAIQTSGGEIQYSSYSYYLEDYFPATIQSSKNIKSKNINMWATMKLEVINKHSVMASIFAGICFMYQWYHIFTSLARRLLFTCKEHRVQNHSVILQIVDTKTNMQTRQIHNLARFKMPLLSTLVSCQPTYNRLVKEIRGYYLSFIY